MDHHKEDHSGHGFGKGQEKLPDSHEKEHEGDFASGRERHDAAREKVRPDFARGKDKADTDHDAARPDYARGQDKK
ncbi:MAG: hypothetical protein ACRDJL_05245 [Actinomycetota bacterium]